MRNNQWWNERLSLTRNAENRMCEWSCLLFAIINITFYCLNWYHRRSINKSDLNKIWNISPFPKWTFSIAILTYGKITSYQWVFLKLIKNSGSHLNKKYRHNGIAYDSGMFSVISLSICRDFASSQECVRASQKTNQKVAASLWKGFIYISHLRSFFKYHSHIVEPCYNRHL